MPSIPDVIAHYQRSIEKCGHDHTRLLHCLDKLYKLNITVQHLQDTGVGRTVNTLRKNSGQVGEAAKTLVAKWKEMVTAHESESPPAIAVADEADNMDQHNAPNHNVSPVRDSSTPSPCSKETNKSELSASRSANHKSSKHDRSSSATSRSHTSKHHNGSSSSSKHSSSSGTKKDSEKSQTSGSSKSLSKSHSSLHAQPSSVDATSKHSSNKSRSGDGSKPHAPLNAKSSSNSGHHKHRPGQPGSESSRSKRKADEQSNSRPKEARTSNGVESPEKKRNRSDNDEDDGEIDSSMGTSFADALGMMLPVPKKPSTSKASAPSGSKSSTKSGSSGRHSASISSQRKVSAASDNIGAILTNGSASKSAKPSFDYKRPYVPPALLLPPANLEPLDLDISVAISNDYKPAPHNPILMECVFRNGNNVSSAGSSNHQVKSMSDAELGASMSSKNLRTKVYSGVRTGVLFNVPTLHEMCIRTLQRNIEALEATGGVPYDILKPVLVRATPDQLFTLEDYNPYLIDDSDELWEQHCSRKFRGYKPQEYESWRDMFLRCREEQEVRLSCLTQNIKRTQKVALPVKQTKITFVDTAVKPPRDVLKKQARYGTERVPVCTPAARVASLNTTSNIARPGDARLRMIAGMRDHAQVNNSRVARKAPLMQKTLQHMKGLMKR